VRPYGRVVAEHDMTLRCRRRLSSRLLSGSGLTRILRTV